MRNGVKAGIGVAALLAAAGGAVLYERSRPTSTSSPPSSSSGGGTLKLIAATVTSGNRGAPLVATITLQASGGPTSSSQQGIGMHLSQGSLSMQTGGTASVPALASGATTTVQVTSQGPVSTSFSAGTVGVVFALANGSTISTTFQVAASAAAFAFVSGSFKVQSPVQPGSFAVGTVVVQNTGGTAGVPSISGVTMNSSGADEGHWVAVNPPSIAPGGGQATVTVQSEGTISSVFQGQTLTAALAVS